LLEYFEYLSVLQCNEVFTVKYVAVKCVAVKYVAVECVEQLKLFEAISLSVFLAWFEYEKGKAGAIF